MELTDSNQNYKEVNQLTDENVKFIVKSYYGSADDSILEYFSVYKASDKMLGFLADYWKLQVNVLKNGKRDKICFFIKAVSRINEAKAEMVRQFNLFNIETHFYTHIKKCLNIANLKPWSAKLVIQLDDAMVFEDLNDLNYKLRPKLQRFDMAHTLQALNTLARFHASSIIFEEVKSKEMNKRYTVKEAFGQYVWSLGYDESSLWFQQCLNAALEVVRTYSKRNVKEMSLIEERWKSIWCSALRLNDRPEDRNVLCHRDLWNNNLMFHYKTTSANQHEPDDCLLVDFQAIQFQHPVGDVMLLLYTNLDPNIREDNLSTLLDYYFNMLKNNLDKCNISIDDIFTKASFLASAEEYRLWGLILSGCLIPQIWIDDDDTTRIFSSTENFDDIMSKNKTRFIKDRMSVDVKYKNKVLEIFEEIIQRYCLKQ